MMPTTTVSKRTKSTRHKTRGKQSLLHRPTTPSASEEIQQLRDQIMHLRSTVTEQEESIAFLRDLLSQRWFDAD
jgi:hypothetical protein